MKKNRKHGVDFKLEVLKLISDGQSVRSLSRSLEVSPSLIWKWADEYASSGKSGLSPKYHRNYTSEFRLEVVTYHMANGVFLRESCMRFGIPSQSTLLRWLRSFGRYGKRGLGEQFGNARSMERKKIKKKSSGKPSRLQELEKENLYLRAENDFLKKLDALVQKRQTPPSKKR